MRLCEVVSDINAYMALMHGSHDGGHVVAAGKCVTGGAGDGIVGIITGRERGGG